MLSCQGSNLIDRIPDVFNWCYDFRPARPLWSFEGDWTRRSLVLRQCTTAYGASREGSDFYLVECVPLETCEAMRNLIH